MAIRIGNEVLECLATEYYLNNLSIFTIYGFSAVIGTIYIPVSGSFAIISVNPTITHMNLGFLTILLLKFNKFFFASSS